MVLFVGAVREDVDFELPADRIRDPRGHVVAPDQDTPAARAHQLERPVRFHDTATRTLATREPVRRRQTARSPPQGVTGASIS